MEDGFELPVNYKGKDLTFPARLQVFGYSYKVQVEVNGQLIIFERDEERNWRVLSTEENQDFKRPEKGLLQAVAESLEELTK
jgi:hypothetical protein